jgi:hypothetical protein
VAERNARCEGVSGVRREARAARHEARVGRVRHEAQGARGAGAGRSIPSDRTDTR